MKVAIQNPFFGQFVAETELSRRMYLAAVNLGWEAAEVYASDEIKAFQPDFVIALHNNSPKLAEFPTYGCLWNPLSFFEGTEKFVKHVLTYDGYLVSSEAIACWLHQLLHTTPKVFFTTPFYTSCPATKYQAPNLENPRLLYLGSNWDGSRFRDLFEGLDAQEYMEVYGNPEGWKHLRNAFKGSLPYDGISAFKALNQAGVGLCLHREEHTYYHLPSMRIFEIVASGAVAICGDHPFIRQAFGDSVLYIDSNGTPAEQIHQISAQMRWIKEHQETALAMTAKAHRIFLESYSLEKLLLGIVPHHEHLIQQKGFTQKPESYRPELPQVQLIARLKHLAPEKCELLFNSLAQQTYKNLAVILVESNLNLEIQKIVESYQEKIVIKTIESSNCKFHSSSLWSGLNALNSEYFSLIDEEGIIHPNHIDSLVNLLKNNSDVGVAYSGALEQSFSALDNSSSEIKETINVTTLSHFQPFHLDKFLIFEPIVAANGFVARRSLLDSTILQDPQLNSFEELCLLLHLAKKTKFLFSYETTCENYRQPEPDRPLLKEAQDWSSELSRLKVIFWHQEFAPGKSMQTVHHTYLEQQRLQAERQRLQAKIKHYQAALEQSQTQLQEAQGAIAAMETSKFWKLRAAWFRLKGAFGKDEG